MATAFMKWLETKPSDYDRGIHLLTLGRLRLLHLAIASRHAGPGVRALEIGCGTGSLTAMFADRGSDVTGIDASAPMLAEAEKKIAARDLRGRATLLHMDATVAAERMPPGSFDVVVASLVLSELAPDERSYVLASARRLLRADGRLVIVDEVVPRTLSARLAFYLIRWPLSLLTWLLTRTTTALLRDLPRELSEAGFEVHATRTHLAGSLAWFDAVPLPEVAKDAPPVPSASRLHRRVTSGSLLKDAWALLFRIFPPYPKFRPGLYAVGDPGRDAPVLVTGNYDLTVRRLTRAIDGRIDAWVVVADSAGINVWCAAGGGYFTAEKVVAAVRTTRVAEVVDHRALILPQLSANGVDGWKLREETGWGVHWGPVRADDIPAYLAARRNKTDAMRTARFPLLDRLEMVTVTLGFYGVLLLLPLFVFGRHLFWPATVSLLGLTYFYAVVHPWLPGRDGLWKSIPLTVIAILGLFLWAAVWQPMPPVRLFGWAVGLTGLSVFTSAELQGMSPLMRGEQANWGWEIVIGAALAAAYWTVPLLAGWR